MLLPLTARVVFLRFLYCAIFAMGYLDYTSHPLILFPSIKAVAAQASCCSFLLTGQRLLLSPEIVHQ